MNKTKICKKQELIKTILTATLTVGAVTMTFQGLAQAVLAEEVNKQELVHTSYSLSSSQNTSALSKDNVKPNYKLVDNDLEYYRDKKPTNLDISREEAAEIGVKGLYSVFGLDMNGKEIEMSYNPAQDNLRATWDGTWWVNGKKSNSTDAVETYSFSVDAISGEMHSVIHDRVLNKETNIGFDGKLNGNSAEYDALTREYATKLGIIKGNIKTVEYEGQGFVNNDPDIFFNVTGESGDHAQLRFSRYDKALLAVTYDAGMKQMDVSIQNHDDFAKRAQDYFLENPNATSYEE